jgi:D-galactarolactone cycloisomerase
MTLIRDVRLLPLAYDLPDGRTYGMSRGVVGRRELGLIEVETEDGVVGIGEAWGPARVTAAYLDEIKALFIGRRLFDRELIWSDILAKRYHLGVQSQMTACYSGINIAIHDALGKSLGVGVAELLGGRGRTRIPVYASDGYITRDPANQLPAQLERIAEQGFPGVKIKIGLGPKSDAARCLLAREILGDDALLLVDANGNYSPDLALESIARIRDLHIHLFEEPLPPQDIEGYRRLSARSDIPIAAGEAAYTIFDFARLMTPRAVDVIQPDLTLCGGFDQAKGVVTLCQLQNIRCSPHVWGGPVGLAAALHFMAALPNFPHGDHLPYPRLLEYDVSDNPLRENLLSEPLVATTGEIAVPHGPGLGIELDPDAVERFRADR